VHRAGVFQRARTMLVDGHPQVFLLLCLVALVLGSVALHLYRRQLEEGAHPCLPTVQVQPYSRAGPAPIMANYGALHNLEAEWRADRQGAAVEAGALYPAAGVGLAEDGSRTSTAAGGSSQASSPLTGAASVNRLRGSAYGDINVRAAKPS
jgi:hypothetical protein